MMPGLAEARSNRATPARAASSLRRLGALNCDQIPFAPVGAQFTKALAPILQGSETTEDPFIEANVPYSTSDEVRSG